MAEAALFLGETTADHQRTGTPVEHSSSHLTTHGVIVGMTGSGKTGLGVVLLEEALRAGIPTLVLDPKGDMTNMALRLPGLSADEFAPWVPAGADAAAVAASWKDGLATWALDGSHIADLDARSKVTVYTPGSTAGVSLSVIGSMAPPAGSDDEARRDEVEGLVSGLLSLIGVTGDPLSSREHILLSNLVERAWGAGTALDLGMLVHQVQDPPIRKLGVLEVDSFFPAADRQALALKLNGLLASPSFAAWAVGQPLDIGRLLATDPVPACSVVYLAHLSDDERQFVVTLLLSKLVTWMRSQPGIPDLRALVYMDEVFGYVPPSAAPPAKKPILTILKQARAFGVGMVLSTQNPVDLDYKAISNAGTWMIGRLQTERDVDRLSDGLAAASGGVDVDAMRATIAGLDKREFLLHSTKASGPSTFTTRWTLDYLAGPLTRQQLAGLPGDAGAAGEPAATEGAAPVAAAASPAPAPVGDDQVTVVPQVAADVPVRWVDPAAPWLPSVGADPAGTTWRAGVACRVELLFDDTKADLRHTETFECVVVGLGEAFDPAEAIAVDYDDRDLRDAAPAGAVYELPLAPLDDTKWFTAAKAALLDHLHRERTVTVQRNTKLKLWSRPGESEEQFAARCDAAAQDAEDAEAAKLRDRVEKRLDSVRRAIEQAEGRVGDAQDAASAKQQHEVVSAAGDLLGSFLGGRNRTRSLVGKVKGLSSRRSASAAAADRVEAARERVAMKADELADLEQELADELLDIDARWSAVADETEPVEVGLEKTDVRVTQLALVWFPVTS